MKYIIDSYAWIEYFEGTDLGKKVKEIVENKDNEIITNILNISELSNFFERKGLEFDKAYKIIISLSKIYKFDILFSKEAGKLCAQIKKDIKNFGLIDAFVLLTAKKINAKILTGDKHFKSFKEAIIL